MKKIPTLFCLVFIFVSGYSQPKVLNKIYNSLLGVRYNVLSQFIYPINFGDDYVNIPLEDGQILSNDYVSQAQDYWHVVKPECVEFTDSSVLLYTEPFNQISYNIWQDSTFCRCKTGWLQFQQKGYSYPYGTWECTVKFSKHSLPAVWMLKERYPSDITSDTLSVSNYIGNQIVLKNKISDYVNWFCYSGDGLERYMGEIVYQTDSSIFLNKIIPDSLYNYHVTVSRDNIIPEVDLLEIINGRLTQSVHWGLQLGTYKKHHLSNQVCEPTKDTYRVAVSISPKKYKFYIDGVLTTVVWNKPSNHQNYIILTNAPDSLGLNETNVVEMSDLRYYKEYR